LGVVYGLGQLKTRGKQGDRGLDQNRTTRNNWRVSWSRVVNLHLESERKRIKMRTLGNKQREVEKIKHFTAE